MSKLYNFEFTFRGTATYTAATEEEALDKLNKEYGDVDVVDTDVEEFDANEDDYMG